MIEVVFGDISLDPEGIFVFGSNLAGIHAGGAARDALEFYGATTGVGQGISGRSYALPTKRSPFISLSLEEIKTQVDIFVQFASSNPKMKFYLTSVGTNIAGFTVHEVASIFTEIPMNIVFTNEPNGTNNLLGQAIMGIQNPD
jgi:hypothetical protein